LKYNLLQAKEENRKRYSLLAGPILIIIAVALQEKENGFKTIGIVRGMVHDKIATNQPCNLPKLWMQFNLSQEKSTD
jgi:hypothetical protein